jgi:hypothetical protein
MNKDKSFVPATSLKPSLSTICNAAYANRPSGYKPTRKHVIKYKTAAYVYYLMLTHRETNSKLYKIGYCTTSVEYRVFMLGCGSHHVKIIDRVRFASAYKAYIVEQLLHDAHAACRYRGKRVISSGNSELYVKDVLKLDIRN